MIVGCRVVLLPLLCWSLCTLAAPPLPAPNSPPRIGVVLGGGGARGFAHLGVLQELEKLHIPIACIAGTSAGALIGGMYANGMPLAEMKQSFNQTDWNAMLSGKAERAQVPYERKSDDYRNYFDVTFGVRDGVFRVPRSAINSQDVDLYIRQLTHDRHIDSFDHLPIPFRAIATDLSNGDAVVFDRGLLATALRASMAVPGLFDPVSDQGRLLIDGGVARNLPIEDLKHRCADHVIVVDVGTPLMKTEQIHTLFDVIAQTSNLLVTRNVRQQKALLDDQDVVIRPDLNGYSSASFVDNQAIIARGVAAVAPVRDKLAAWSLSDADYQAWHARLVAPVSPKIDRVEVVDVAKANTAATTDASTATSESAQRLGSEAAGLTAAKDLDTARQELRALFAAGDYDSLSYRVQNIDGRNVLQVMPVERSIGPTYLRFGLNLKSSSPGTASFNFLASSLNTWVNSAGATWRNDLQLGSDMLFRSEFYQPLSLGSPMFVAAQARYKESTWPFFDSKHLKTAELDLVETGGELDVGVALGRYGQLRGGPYWLQYNPRVNMGALTPQQQVWDQPATEAGFRLSGVVDQFDNPRWPRRGYFVEGDLRYSQPSWGGVDTRYYGLTAEQAVTVGDVTWRLTGKLKGNLDVSEPGRFMMPQFLGGFLNMSGYQQDELYGEKVGLGRMMVYWRAATLPSALGSGVYAGASLEAGKVWRRNFEPQDTGWLPGASIFLGADTLIGPFFVGLGSARGGQWIGYMYLGLDY